MHSLSGKRVVFTGKVPGYTRATLKQWLTSQDIVLASGLSGKVDYLVYGERLGDRKRAAANRLKVPIISYADFQTLLNPNQAQAFWGGEPPTGDEPAEAFLQAIERLDWERFDPHQHGEALRDLLVKQEGHHGVHAAHRVCSERVRHHLKLLHPFGHDDVINDHGVSADGRWLATGSWSSESYERGGVLQIWEVATGRVVNRLRIRGGVGWSDYKGIEWSPTTNEVALAYDTNGVGVWDPFAPTRGTFSSPRVHAYVTNGNSRPPWFTWASDGKSVFIQANIDQQWSEDNDDYDEDRGCWVPTHQTLGNIAGLAEPGTVEERIRPATAAEATKVQPEPQVGEDSVVFPHLEGHTFRDRPPGSRHPLYDGANNLALRFPIKPQFPVKHGEEELWGVAFEQGAMVIPRDYRAEETLSLSLGCKWAWPLRWADFVIRAASLPELAQKHPTFMPHILRTFQNQPIPTTSPGKQVWPPQTGRTLLDVRKITIDTLVGLGRGWSGHTDEYLFQVVLTDLQRGDLDGARAVMKHIQQYRRDITVAQMSFHAAARGHETLAREYLDEARAGAEAAIRKKEGHKICLINGYLAGCHHFLGDAAQARVHLDIAKAHCIPEVNSGQHAWPLFTVMLSMGLEEEAQASALEWKLDRSIVYTRDALFNVVWYGTLEQLIRLKAFFEANEIMSEYDCTDMLVNKILHDRAYDRLEEVYNLFESSSYRDWIVARVVDGMVQTGTDITETVSHFLPKTSKGYRNHWVHTLAVAARHAPEVAAAILDGRDWTLKDTYSWDYYADGKYRVFFELGEVIGLLDKLDDFEAELANAGRGTRALILAGSAAHRGPVVGEVLLQRAAEDLTEDLGMYYCQIWHKLAAASHMCGSPNEKVWVNKAIEITFEKDKDLDMERMVARLAQSNALASAYRTWMKIPTGTRRYRVVPLLGGACHFQNYDVLCEVLLMLDSDDLNDRGQKAVQAMNTLTSSLGYRM